MGADTPPPATGFRVSVNLKPTWDSALTYDLVDDARPGTPPGIFVGRESLVGPLVKH